METDVFTQIKIVDRESIYPFEWTDESPRERDGDDEEPQLVRHPFPVSALDDETYLLLEDTALFDRLSRAGVRHVPVQVIPREQIHARESRLGLIGFGPDQLLRVSLKYAEQIRIGKEVPLESFDNKYLQLKFTFTGGSRVTAWLRHTSQTGCPIPLEHLFRAISGSGRYFPLLESETRSDSGTCKSNLSGAVVVPSFGLRDLCSAASSDRLFPPGIVKVKYDCRVLNVDLPLAVLNADSPLEEKESFIRELIVLRARKGRISRIEGRVVLLNR